ncbi:peptide ABC transporter substrate-binding protein [Halobacteriales archaeon SW_6_65_46]|nr:MAG: peptide ABC transporter substrate-binding protein [Halobacteriales archaeon SW_6_65_46]
MSRETDRRTFLTLAGSVAGTAALAGCSDGGTEPNDSGDGGTSTDAEESLPEPETRDDYLQRANLLLNQDAPWIYLNRQYSVYGKSTDVEWEARRDERIDGDAIEPLGSKSTVTITQSGLGTGLDPHDHRETTTDNIVLQAYEGLLTRDREGRVTKQLASSYERIEPGVVEFGLRSGVSFHTGDSMTKEDVAFSINRMVQDDVGITSPQADQLPGVTGAEVVDGNSAVRVNSDGINPIVFASFATYCDIVNKSWITSNERAYINTNMNGTGPFMLDTYEQDVEVVFTSYDDYYGDAPPADSLVIKGAPESSTRVNQLLTGEIDIAVNVPPQSVSEVRNSEDTEISAVPSTRVLYNGMMYDREPFDSVEFRQAMNHAVDMESIIENVLSSFGAAISQPTVEGFFGYNSDVDPYEYDVERAEQLVEESGYAGAEITLHTPVGRYLQDLEIAQAVVGFLDDLSNVSASVKQRDFGSLANELVDGDITTGPDFYLIGWGNATFDASQTIIPTLTSDGSLTSYEDDRVDELVEQAQSMGSQN